MRRFRFSLLTLLLFMFLLGSVGLFTLRIKDGPWKRTPFLKDSQAEIWSASSGDHILVKEPMQPVKLISVRDGSHRVIYGANGHFVDFSPDGRLLLTTVGGSREVAVWDTVADRSRILEGYSLHEYMAWGYIPDGSRVINVGTDSVSVWNSATGKLVWSHPGYFHHRLAISSSDKWLLAYGREPYDSEPAQLQLYNVKDGTRARSIPLADVGRILILRFSPHDDMLLIGEDFTSDKPPRPHRTRIFETHRFTEVGRFDTILDSRPRSFSPDHRYFAWGDQNGFVSYDFKTAQQTRPTKEVSCDASFSPSGSRVVTDFGKLFRHSDGKLLYEFGHARRARFLSETMLVTEDIGAVPKDWAARDITTVYRWDRQYPEDWWGYAALREFWMMLAFAAACAWSIWRDRRI